MKSRLLNLFLVVALLATSAIWFAPTGVARAEGPDGGRSAEHRKDNLKHPLGARQFGLRQKALEAKLQGKARGKTFEVAKGQYVELEQTGTDRIFVVLAEFGDQIDPRYGGTAGPAHNEIAEPDRTLNNTTHWKPDFSRQHFQDLYFSSAAGFDSVNNYYKAQSSGRYGVEGAVTDWVKVPYNAARYGSNSCEFGGSNEPPCVWILIQDAINIWTEQQLASGKTPEQVKAELATFDVWDRYDHDGDGNFDEPDGYIDHFQIVHAGEGEEAGGGAQGGDAIWSHRWYAFYTGIGTEGPANAKFGGTAFGDTGIWVGDYTIQPENGGLGVFAHEYAHDLGLPDLYDTSYMGESPTGFWSLMASGSWLGNGGEDIGSRPNDLGAWEKFQLGWLNYDVAFAGKRSAHRVGPAETNTKAAQGLFVVLPKRERVLQLATPPEGTMAWWSGMGDNLDHTMVRTVDVPADLASAALNMQVWYDIEPDWDYAYVSVSADNGATWANLSSSITTNDDPHGQNFGNGITGSSGGWIPVTFDLSAYAGQTVLLRFRYWTDGYVQEKGFMADAITVGSFTDGAENGANGWTLNGFKATAGQESSYHSNYYLAEFRQYRSYDTTLQTGPYNFSFVDRPDWVEHFPYQDGLLISYWDTSMPDNNVGAHPGEGQILPIDAHPEPLIAGNGQPWRTRVQVYDAPFGLEPTDPITLSYTDWTTQYPAVSYPSLPAVPVFNDLNTYWYPSKPDAGVKVPATGTAIEVVRYNTMGNFMEVLVRPAR